MPSRYRKGLSLSSGLSLSKLSVDAVALNLSYTKVEPMPYKFSFDLSSISKSFFKELARVANEKKLHKRFGLKARGLAEKFKLAEITGLDVPDALQLVEDLVDVYVQNVTERERFEKTKKRALFLPHCSRKFMDNRCKATFYSELPSYKCAHCSADCLINQATQIGEKKGYDVYVLPGGSCVTGILKRNRYEGVVGVACGQEMKLGGDGLKQMGLAGQAVPLIKNGCANTSFSLQNLEKTL
jgi:hypothetical protein